MDTGQQRLRIAVIMAVHNRREVTLRGLTSLYNANPAFDFSVVLFDDGSTDGTSAAVRAAFAKTIILAGDGSAFWNGATFAAWRHAQTLEPDGYLWLNDDVVLAHDALERLLDIWTAIGGPNKPVVIAGATHGADGKVSYGGFHRVASRWLFRYRSAGSVDEPTPIDFCSGQVVLINQAAVDILGINDPRFFHGLGDWDYGLRAKRAGVGVWLAPGTVGRCDSWVHPMTDLDKCGLRERWRRTTSIKAFPLRNWFLFTRVHCGPLFLASFVGLYLRAILGPNLLPAYRQLVRAGKAIKQRLARVRNAPSGWKAL